MAPRKKIDRSDIFSIAVPPSRSRKSAAGTWHQHLAPALGISTWHQVIAAAAIMLLILGPFFAFRSLTEVLANV
jgi:hypothetical protein